VVVISRLNPKFISQMKAMKIPVVTVGSFYPDMGVDMVFTDDFKGSYKTVKYLIEMGHKKICHLRGPDYSVADNRFKGYRAALVENGIEYDEALVENGEFWIDTSRKAMTKILDKNLGVTAAFCGDDWSAFGAKEAIEKRGLKVPDDISLVGYDNIEASAQINPALTTVNIPKEELGHIAVKRLNNLINGIDTETMLIELQTTIVKRDSVKNIS
jgi:LacI family transcriptional regulator